MSTSYDKDTWEVIHRVEAGMAEQERERIFRFHPEIKKIMPLGLYLTPKALEELQHTNIDVYKEVMRLLQTALQRIEETQEKSRTRATR